MQALTITDSETMILALQDEIRRSEESRYDHRLHGVLLVAEGFTCGDVAKMLGDAPRTVEYWVHRFADRGFGGLLEGERSGRPTQLTGPQLEQVSLLLRGSPRAAGVQANLWDGPTLRQWLKSELNVKLSVRSCQRLFRRLEFRLRKPRPEIGPSDPEQREELEQARTTHKKTPAPGQKSRRRPLGDG
jgi:transposase